MSVSVKTTQFFFNPSVKTTPKKMPPKPVLRPALTLALDGIKRAAQTNIRWG